MWGNNPWDNDMAADWFGNLMGQTNLPNIVRKTLLLANEQHNDFFEYSSKLRAAIYCLLHFGRVYIWPINNLKDDLKLAIFALETILEDEEYCVSSAIKLQIKEEMEILKTRLKELKQ